MKILHILYQSLPQISGSSIRSRDILMSQIEVGLDSFAMTSPFQASSSNAEIINGVKYLRTTVGHEDTISDKQKSIIQRVFRFVKIFSFYSKLNETIKREEPNVLHAHAMFFCGLPAVFLGKKHNLPVVYEVRSLWMLKKTGKKRVLDSIVEKILFGIELYVMRKANVVIAINENLKQVLVQRKIDPSKIMVIKNAVNTSLINSLKEEHSNNLINEKNRFGYIGTLTPHEGIDFLINCFSTFSEKFPKATLSIYGKGVEEQKIRDLANKCSNVTFHGAVHPENIFSAFDAIDFIVNPRVKNKLTDSVTPLKPLEAMAYEKIVIGSDVGGIKELIANNVNGLLFEADNQEALVKTMETLLLLDSKEQQRITKNALKYVYEEKSWIQNAREYKLIYSKMIKHKDAERNN